MAKRSASSKPASTSPSLTERRKPARRMSEIPRDVLDQLNRGETETINLVEWLAVDQTILLRHALGAIRPRMDHSDIVGDASGIKSLGVMDRLRVIASMLHRTATALRDSKLRDDLASHRSDTVRNWASLMLACDEEMALPERLAATRRFAADSHMGVRECAWMALRVHLVRDLPRAIELLAAWSRDVDANVRRCASEATRPRGVWCQHIDALKTNPEQAIAILEPLRSDPSRYVQTSVANWLNDASKTCPDWVRGVCKRWLRESPTPETRWIVNHATRTMRKAAEAGDRGDVTKRSTSKNSGKPSVSNRKRMPPATRRVH